MNILLLGDSIQIGYQKYVEEKLGQDFNVYFTQDNGRFSTYFLWYMKDWFSDRHYDIVHFNFGLWDIVRLTGEKQCFTSENCYRDCCERILMRMKNYWNVDHLIFALTTAVKEPCVVGGGVGTRNNKDIIRYNDIARDVIEKMSFHIDINDLYLVSSQFPEDMYFDDTHFNTSGYELLGEAVCKCIVEAIDK